MSENEDRILRDLLLQVQEALMRVAGTVGRLQADAASAQRSRAIVRAELQAQRGELREMAKALSELARATESVAEAVARLEPRLEAAERAGVDWNATKRAGRWWLTGVLIGASAGGAALSEGLKALLRSGG